MINTSSVLAEYIRSLGPPFKIDAVLENGVSFYATIKIDTKFTLAIAPMFGVEKGQVGLVITKHGHVIRDRIYEFEDPDLLDNIFDRIIVWIKNMDIYI